MHWHLRKRHKAEVLVSHFVTVNLLRQTLSVPPRQGLVPVAKLNVRHVIHLLEPIGSQETFAMGHNRSAFISNLGHQSNKGVARPLFWADLAAASTNAIISMVSSISSGAIPDSNMPTTFLSNSR